HEQPALGLEQAHVRRTVAGGLVGDQRAEIGLDLDAVQERAVGLDDRGDPGRPVAGPPGVLLEHRRGYAAVAAYLDPARQAELEVLDRSRGVPGVRVHP